MSSEDVTPVSGRSPDTGTSVPAPEAGSGPASGPESGRGVSPAAPTAAGPGGWGPRAVLRRLPVRRVRLGRDARAGAADPTAGATSDPTEAMAGSIERLAEPDLDVGERRRLLGRLASQVRARGGVSDTFKPSAALRWVADTVGDLAPHVPIRGRETLRKHFPGMTDDEVADRLIRNAARATAAIGAAGGGVAAVEWVATPTLLTAPVVLAAETVAVVTVEIKLLGELHEIYGRPVTGSATQRGVALMTSWAHRRGVNPLVPGVGVAAVLGTAARRDLRDRLLRRFGRNLTSFGPFLTGAAVASYLNRRATLALAGEIRKDLRGKRLKVIDGSAQ